MKKSKSKTKKKPQPLESICAFNLPISLGKINKLVTNHGAVFLGLMQNETCHFQVLITLLSEDVMLLLSLKHYLEMKVLNVLFGECNTLYFSVCQVKLFANFDPKTVLRLQMDLENMKCVWSGKGTASALFETFGSHWASESFLQTAQWSSARRQRLCIEAVNETQEPDFPF